ncbi:TPA: hypothetical protein SB541_000155 [Campylobacter jejuni]|nr:hypothetical protein [Campylobacter jejuni]
MASYKKWVFLVLLFPIPIIFILIMLIYFYDPLQLYHKPFLRNITFSSDLRVQAAGIINNYNFDSVIIGTSMLENSSKEEANKKLEGQWVNLSLSGSYLNERSVVMKYLFNKKNIHQIIYSLDVFTLNYPLNKDTSNFDYLYNDSFVNPLRLYLNFKNPKFIICALTNSTKEKCVGKYDLENVTKWIIRKHIAFDFKNWDFKDKKLVKAILNAQKFNPKYNINIETNKKYIDTKLLDFIKAHPNTQFHLIIPTYSRMLYRILFLDKGYYYNKNSILFSKYQAILKWLIKETSKYPNVKIYGFDDLSYADNIANYKDPVHYNIDMNSMQLDAIKNHTHILTPENMDKYFKIMEEKIKNYDLNPFLIYIKKNKLL